MGCSDTYFASQSANQSDLGSRAWINPFTGIFPTTARNHTGHAHSDISHMLLVESDDLNQTMNPGATYYAELLYVTPDEYAWCQTHPGECNMYNNASSRRYNVTGTTTFTFTAGGSAVRMTPAVNAWTGATINPIEPAPAWMAVRSLPIKCQGQLPEFTIMSMRSITEPRSRNQSFSVPGCGIAVSIWVSRSAESSRLSKRWDPGRRGVQ